MHSKRMKLIAQLDEKTLNSESCADKRSREETLSEFSSGTRNITFV